MLRLLKGYGQGGQGIGDGVHSQDLACIERCAEAQHACANNQAEFTQVAAKQQTKRAAYIAPETASLDEGLHQGREIVVGNHHVGRLTCDLGSSHCYTDICEAQGWCIVDPISRHRHSMSTQTQAFDNTQLVHRSSPGDHCCMFQMFSELVIAQFSHLGSGEHFACAIEQAYLLSDRTSSSGVVARNHHNAYSCILAAVYRDLCC